MIRSISRSLHKFGEITIKASVVLNSSPSPNYRPKKAFRLWVAKGNETSFYYDYATFITLDFLKYGETYDKNKRFSLFSCQVWKLIQAIDAGLEFLNKNDVFYIDKDTKKTCLYAESKKYKYLSKGYISNGIIMVEPVVVTDASDITYEGLRFSFNRLNNFVDLSIDEVQGMRYLLAHTDFMVLSQVMVNSLLTWQSDKLKQSLSLEESSSADINYSVLEDHIAHQSASSMGLGNPFKGLKERKN